jgi:hypothetical protein
MPQRKNTNSRCCMRKSSENERGKVTLPIDTTHANPKCKRGRLHAVPRAVRGKLDRLPRGFPVLIGL